MTNQNIAPPNEILTEAEIQFEGIPSNMIKDFSIKQIILAESLLSPSLQTSITIQSHIHTIPTKNWDKFKGVTTNINIIRPILKKYGYNDTLNISQTCYRLGGKSTRQSGNDDRKLINPSIEEFTIHLCDPTLLVDAASLVSRAWKCTKPSQVVEDVLRGCVGAKRLNIESADPARDYIAENITPFQVVNQQASVSLAGGDDPSFVHFMTYEDLGTHHFRSLDKMTQQSPVATLIYNTVGSSYSYPNSIMSYSFPCDFDLLSDILNGVGQDGKGINSLALFNPVRKTFSLLGNQTIGCGIGGGDFKIAHSNEGSSKDQNSCPDYVSTYLNKRQARMTLLEKDKVALRLTVPWNPIFNAGKVIRIELRNPENPTDLIYGSGDYLIASLVHDIKIGGYSTITMDCVSETTGNGEV